MAETNWGARRRRTVVGPARVLRKEYGIKDLNRDVLLRVLSRLEARQAVQTCLLSRLWRDLWRDMPCIKATCLEFEIKKDGGYAARKLLFKKFVNRLLMLRNTVPLDEFRLWYNFSYDGWFGDDHVEAELEDDYAGSILWIRHALLCNARSVEVVVWEDRLEIIPAVFTSEHLTSLVFYKVVLNPGFFGQLQTGCKALERLALQDCAINDFEISSQTLKFLSIGTDCWFPLESHDQASISAPNLIHLSIFYHEIFDRLPMMKNMESLVTAYVNLGKFNFNGILADDIHQFLLGLSGVQKLIFYPGRTGLITGDNLQRFPIFNNLKFLALDEHCLYPDLDGLICFLQNSPNLEQLTLDLYLKRYGVVVSETPIGVPGNGLFTFKHLKIVEIICSKHDPAVTILKEFLLGSGITLGQIHIKN